MAGNGKALLSGFEFENIKLEQMNNKELLIDFIEYAKSRHVVPVLHSNIEPLVDDYFRQQNLQQCNVSSSGFVSGCCEGEKCSVCGNPATNKLEETIFHDDPYPMRHPLTAYVCKEHFRMIVGSLG